MLRLNASVLAMHMRELIAVRKVKSPIIAVNDVPLYISRRRGQRLPQLGLDGSEERTDKRLEPLRIIAIDDKMQRFSVRREGYQHTRRALNWAKTSFWTYRSSLVRNTELDELRLTRKVLWRNSTVLFHARAEAARL